MFLEGLLMLPVTQSTFLEQHNVWDALRIPPVKMNSLTISSFVRADPYTVPRTKANRLF
ncbi:hypothetical protein L915_22012 [Phytophthora nicotianae]|uniref:Uncharacterized protein n=1 Tax=Phytophthora nicotianae TaxID=4792 RepID=W2FL55_PHYNI|nr:hypothetical protein L915_22012 [Phytophthora nicotianae]